MDVHIQIGKPNAYAGQTLALKDIDITIPHSQITVILCPPGCGKTTPLNYLNWFLELDGSTRISRPALTDLEDSPLPRWTSPGYVKRSVYYPVKFDPRIGIHG